MSAHPAPQPLSAHETDQRLSIFREAAMRALGHACVLCGATDHLDVFVQAPQAQPMRLEHVAILCGECVAAYHAPGSQTDAALTVWLDRALHDVLAATRPVSMTATLERLIAAAVVAPSSFWEEAALYEERPEANIKLTVRIPRSLRMRLMTAAQRMGWTAKRTIHALLQMHDTNTRSPADL
jgi:hypothetical protein